MARQGTEEQLERAALALLREHGVLAGLNLRAVADLAGVNRGNVYHYFGSRRQLLQSALRRRLQRNRHSVDRKDTSSFEAWIAWFFKFMIQQSDPVGWTALLVLDGDHKQDIMTFYDILVEDLRDFQARGELDPSIDPAILHVLISSATRGYVIHRRPLARQVGMRQRDLDEKVAALFAYFVTREAPDAAATPSEPAED